MSNEKKLHKNRLFKVLGISNNEELTAIARKLKINTKTLRYYNDNMIFPDGKVLNEINKFTGYSELELKLRLGVLDNKVIEWIADNPQVILNSFEDQEQYMQQELNVKWTTKYGELYQNDCIKLMKSMPNESVDLIFADPPFNLGKTYTSGIDDYLSERHYLQWTEEWLLECIRILSPGGSIFVYNIPYWQTHTASILNKYLNFRHWIALYIRGLMPISGKLNPSHYGLLYYVKGDKPNVFNKQRVPMTTCRHCGGEIHDYGGKKKDLNSQGISIADVWTDINPVRHKKFKNREANELPLKLLHRIISLASNEGDIVFDPFGGSGTTFVAAEYLKRRWIGAEIGEVNTIINRLKNKEKDFKILEGLDKETNVLFTEDQLKLRMKNNFWTYEKLNSNNNKE